MAWPKTPAVFVEIGASLWGLPVRPRPEHHPQHHGQSPQGSTDKRAPPGYLDYIMVLARFTQPHGGTFQDTLGRHRTMMLSAYDSEPRLGNTMPTSAVAKSDGS